jgi:hypothetical protein
LAIGSCANPIVPTDPLPPGTGVLVGAGDVADCGPGAESTARLLDQIQGTVFAAGDMAYPDGSTRDYADCYEPTWGRHRDRTRAVPGNHEYFSPGARPFYEYFGENAGPPGLGYFVFRVHAWKIIGLNSEIDSRPGSPQMQWLRSELMNQPADCTIAIWHRPLYTSGPNRPNTDMREMFRLLYEFGTELVLNGHDHLYERFAPQDADGRTDFTRGVRQFTVGTGGVALYTPLARQPNSEALQSVWGVLKLTLAPGRYSWEFVPVQGSTFRDTGASGCH